MISSSAYPASFTTVNTFCNPMSNQSTLQPGETVILTSMSTSKKPSLSPAQKKQRTEKAAKPKEDSESEPEPTVLCATCEKPVIRARKCAWKPNDGDLNCPAGGLLFCRECRKTPPFNIQNFLQPPHVYSDDFHSIGCSTQFYRYEYSFNMCPVCRHHLTFKRIWTETVNYGGIDLDPFAKYTDVLLCTDDRQDITRVLYYEEEVDEKQKPKYLVLKIKTLAAAWTGSQRWCLRPGRRTPCDPVVRYSVT